MTKDQSLERIARDIDGLEHSQDKDGSLSHTRLGLAKEIVTVDNVRDSLALDLGRVLKAGLASGSYEFLLKVEVLEGRSVGSGLLLGLLTSGSSGGFGLVALVFLLTVA